METQHEAIVNLITTHCSEDQQNLLFEFSELHLLARLLPLLEKFQIISESLSAETDITVSLIIKSAAKITKILDERAADYGGSVALRNHMFELSIKFKSIFEKATQNTSHMDMAAFVDLRMKCADTNYVEKNGGHR